MRTASRHHRRLPLSAFQAIEPLEFRTHLDGVASSMPPVPEVDRTHPVDAATLHALGDQLHTLAGDGTPETANAAPWIDQWFPEEADAHAAGFRHAPLASPLDLAALDDGSGDGVTDDDIYSFNLPPISAESDVPPSQAIISPTSALLWINNPTNAESDEMSLSPPGGPPRTFLS